MKQDTPKHLALALCLKGPKITGLSIGLADGPKHPEDTGYSHLGWLTKGLKTEELNPPCWLKNPPGGAGTRGGQILPVKAPARQLALWTGTCGWTGLLVLIAKGSSHCFV